MTPSLRRTRRARLAAALAVAVGAGLTGESAARDRDAVLDRDFELMMTWFPGRYDNQEQVYFDEEMDAPAEARNERTHHIFFPADLPAFEGRTFYIQQSSGDDLSEIYRQRIYAFAPDYAEGAVRLTIYTPKTPDKMRDAHEDPSKLKGLRPRDMMERPGCEVFWKRRANQFHGYMKEGACTFVSERSGKRIVIQDELALTDREIWVRDTATDESGAYVFGNKAGVPHKNRKARVFTCWMSIAKAGEGDWSFSQGLKLHDQGGMVWAKTDDPPPREAGFKLRNVVWPYGANKPSLVLYAYRPGEKTAAAYGWSEPEAERVGLNLRWVQGSCSLDRSDWANAWAL